MYRGAPPRPDSVRGLRVEAATRPGAEVQRPRGGELSSSKAPSPREAASLPPHSGTLPRHTDGPCPDSGAIEVERAGEAVLPVHEDLVAEGFAGGGDVGQGIAHVADARRVELGLEALCREAVQLGDELEQADGLAGSRVEEAPGGFRSKY